MSREIKAVKNNELRIRDGKVEMIYEKIVTRYGNGAKIDAPKKYLSKRAYVIIMR